MLIAAKNGNLWTGKNNIHKIGFEKVGYITDIFASSKKIFITWYQFINEWIILLISESIMPYIFDVSLKISFWIITVQIFSNIASERLLCIIKKNPLNTFSLSCMLLTHCWAMQKICELHEIFLWISFMEYETWLKEPLQTFTAYCE